MAQVKELASMKSGNPSRIDALIEDVGHLKGLDVEERADVVHALRRVRLQWTSRKLVSGSECRPNKINGL